MARSHREECSSLLLPTSSTLHYDQPLALAAGLLLASALGWPWCGLLQAGSRTLTAIGSHNELKPYVLTLTGCNGTFSMQAYLVSAFTSLGWQPTMAENYDLPDPAFLGRGGPSCALLACHYKDPVSRLQSHDSNCDRNPDRLTHHARTYCALG